MEKVLTRLEAFGSQSRWFCWHGGGGVRTLRVMLSTEGRKTLAMRATQGMREVGVLLVAFAPLDYSMQESIDPLMLAGFLVTGLMLFLGSVYWEIRQES